MNKKNYILVLCVQRENDVQITEAAAEVAAVLKEFVDVKLGGDKLFTVSPDGDLLFPKKS
jgi:hypothetical protein